jgi:hypothetical protein
LSESRGSRRRQTPPKNSARSTNAGLPAPESVVSVRTLTSSKGVRYRILKTNEKDAYDPPDDKTKGGG